MTSNVSVVRKVAWVSALPQLLIMGLLIFAASLVLPFREALIAGAATYLLGSQVLRRVLAADHNNGIKHLHAGQPEEAIQAFMASYDFFSRHPWVDRLRYLTLLSSTAYSYREMALCNIGFIHLQQGRGEEALEWYRKALAEFPKCHLAKVALRSTGDLRTLSG